jgi:uncharacterized membrane protein YgcG
LEANETMKRREFLSGLAISVTLSGQALAQDYAGSVMAQLSEMGFSAIRQERTLLGRVRITGTREDGRREIILNPNSGEILRDLWIPDSGDTRIPDIIKDKSSDRSGKGGGDDDEDDDEDDDDSDDDEGGGNSGSGSGSGSGGGSSESGSGGGGDDDEDGD